jgi:hypothetical protein
MFTVVKGDECGVVPRVRYPWPHTEMAVGDSFEVPVGRVKLGVLYNANYRWGKRLGARFVSRVQPSGSIKVWRVA